MIPIKGFAPDADPHIEGVITECSDMMPCAEGFKTAPSAVTVGYAALSTACKGAALLLKLDGTYRLIAGEVTSLSSGAADSWTDVTRTSGGAYSLGTSDRWRFGQFGDVTLAAAKSETTQFWAAGTDFADISGAPKADLIEVVNGFVMLANTNDGTYGDQKDRWWCSAYRDYTDWTPAISTQCTTGRLVDSPGRITALKKLGSMCIAYKQHSIFVGQYIGSPLVWSWQQIPGDFGAETNEAVVSIGTAHFFIGRDEIWAFDGSVPTPIGNDVKDWFFDDLDKTYAYKIDGIHDRLNSNVIWFYPSDGSGGVLDSALIYNYKYQRWGHASYSIEAAVDVITDATTYESIGSDYSTYDDLPAIAYDSPFWQASAPVMGVFNTSHVAQTLTGVGGTMTMTTGYLGSDERYTLVRRITPRFSIAPSSGSLTNYYRNTSGSSDIEDQTVSLSSGRFDLLRSAMWHKARFSFTGDCQLNGFTPDVQVNGGE